MEALHPGLDFSACDEEWNYKPHCFEDVADRAAEVRKELMNLPGPHIVVVGHRGFISFLVDTNQVDFGNCGTCLFLPILASYFDWLTISSEIHSY